MKQMVYSLKAKTEILHSGSYEGYGFYIVSYGVYPCAYIEIPKGHRWFGREYYEKDILHGIAWHRVLTYSGNLGHVIGENDKWFIGWDYGHAGDYVSPYELSQTLSETEKKWTTEEIFEEVKKVIGQLKSLDETLTKEELYDGLIVEDKVNPQNWFVMEISEFKSEENADKKHMSDRWNFYAFIKTDKGLIYVAKMNKKGELELL